MVKTEPRTRERGRYLSGARLHFCSGSKKIHTDVYSVFSPTMIRHDGRIAGLFVFPPVQGVSAAPLRTADGP